MSKQKTKSKLSIETMRKIILNTSAQQFLQKGFSNTTLREISKLTGFNIGSIVHIFPHKENILSGLIDYTIDSQFGAAQMLLEPYDVPKIYHYAVDTVLELYITEAQESIRDLYIAAYTKPDCLQSLNQKMVSKISNIFASQFPDYEEKDFYELEIASASIMYGYISTPCTMYFTIDRKVRRFLETSLRIYRVPEETINEIINFVSQFDFVNLSKQFIERTLQRLNNPSDNIE